MSCERFTGALIDHAAGANLPADVRAHLDGCAGCREALGIFSREMSDLDRDLESMLAAEPSVEFAARVRLRVEAERDSMRTFGWWRWALGAASLAAAGVVIALLMQGRTVAPRPVDPPAVAKAPETPAPVPPPASLAPEQHAPALRVAVRTTSAPPILRTPASSTPVVLVPPDQRLAIARLQAMARSGRLDERGIPDDPAAANLEPAAVPPLVVDSLKLTPIAVDGGRGPGGGDSRPRPQAAERAGRSSADN